MVTFKAYILRLMVEQLTTGAYPHNAWLLLVSTFRREETSGDNSSTYTDLRRNFGVAN